MDASRTFTPKWDRCDHDKGAKIRWCTAPQRLCRSIASSFRRCMFAISNIDMHCEYYNAAAAAAASAASLRPSTSHDQRRRCPQHPPLFADERCSPLQGTNSLHLGFWSTDVHNSSIMLRPTPYFPLNKQSDITTIVVAWNILLLG